MAGLLAGLVPSLGASNQRPDVRAAADFIDASAGPRDPYLETQLYFSKTPELRRGVTLYFERPHPAVGPLDFRPEAGGVRPVADRSVWLAAARGRRVFFVRPQLPSILPLRGPPTDLAGRVRRVETRRYPGIFAMRVVVYGPAR